MRSRPRSSAMAYRPNWRIASTRACDAPGSDPLRVDGPLATDLSRVHGRLRLEEQDVNLLAGDGTMLRSPWDHRELTFTKVDRTVRQVDPEAALQHVEQFVLPRMVVPDELAVELHQLHVRIVQLGDDLRLPIVANPIQFRSKIYRRCWFLRVLRHPVASFFPRKRRTCLRIMNDWTRPGSSRSTLLDPAAAEQREESDRKDAEQEREIHPGGRSAPIHVPRIAGDRDELQDGERGVSPCQRLDPGDIVLAVRMEGGEADPDEPRPGRSRGQGRQDPRPYKSDEIRQDKEAHTKGEHPGSLAEDERPHPCCRGRPARRIASGRMDLKPSDKEHHDRDAGVDREPEPRRTLCTRDRAREMELAEMEEGRDERERREEPNRRDRDAGLRPDRLSGANHLDGDCGPVGRPEECGRERRGDGPREGRVRLLRGYRELGTRREHDGASRIQKATHRGHYGP